ncbi:hypothetical protein F5884DRAFT_419384 [Xylogone sp. PMI_703]|nr:hypothetical protein F5884DRAFT_419384 [Xylogone sp. PMI_703]
MALRSCATIHFLQLTPRYAYSLLSVILEQIVLIVLSSFEPLPSQNRKVIFNQKMTIKKLNTTWLFGLGIYVVIIVHLTLKGVWVCARIHITRIGQNASMRRLSNPCQTCPFSLQHANKA